MKKNNVERVMAYSLAQTINHADLTQVAGGGANGHTCRITNKNVVINGLVSAQIDTVCD